LIVEAGEESCCLDLKFIRQAADRKRAKSGRTVKIMPGNVNIGLRLTVARGGWRRVVATHVFLLR
jgi:hypothetical protein